MPDIAMLRNPIQYYAWGSQTAIPELLGQPPSRQPQAELWMGAHPKAPSEVLLPDGPVPLDRLISRDPEAILGRAVARQFRNELPFLFKVLAAAQPLSIQAHPDQTQAREGFERENRSGIPMDAPHRNYRDPNHKPECICALTPFWGLNGFRTPREIASGIAHLCPETAEALIRPLQSDGEAGLRSFFHQLMTLDPERKSALLAEALAHARMMDGDSVICKWMLRLHRAYPEDIGLLSPLFLNLIRLEPGQAMFLKAGELHAYLDGVGIELMANSDNVLRGGLTPKHMDVPELLKVLNFESREVEILRPEPIGPVERRYPTPAPEFTLSVIHLTEAAGEQRFAPRSVEILLCTEGRATLRAGSDRSVEKGDAFLVPASVEAFSLQGDAVFHKASVPRTVG